jgi:hypothetical protein
MRDDRQQHYDNRGLDIGFFAVLELLTERDK